MVSFSSCLDVAAISMDMGEALDTNKELMTVGISNCKFLASLRVIHRGFPDIFLSPSFSPVVSGLFGGFTGSYIFSQTIFTYRTGCRSRWVGALVSLVFIRAVYSTHRDY